MSLRSSVETNLKNGSWAVHEISEHLKASLERALKAPRGRYSVPELALARYQRVPLEDSVLGFRKHNEFAAVTDLSGRSLAAVERIIQQEHPDGIPFLFFRDEVEKMNQALALIARERPELRTLIDRTVAGFLRVKGVQFRSASHAHLMGVIFIGDGISEQSYQQLAVSVVHELAHQELFHLNLLDRLVCAEFEHHEIHAPFQGRSRPPIGRLHSLWALYRMVQFQQSCAMPDPKYRMLLAKNVESFEDGELTPMAKALVSIAAKLAA